MNYLLKDLTQKSYSKRGYHRKKRCQISAGKTYGDMVIHADSRSIGSGTFINKKSFMNAISNANEELLLELKHLIDKTLNKLSDEKEVDEEESQEESQEENVEVQETDEEKTFGNYNKTDFNKMKKEEIEEILKQQGFTLQGDYTKKQLVNTALKMQESSGE